MTRRSFPGVKKEYGVWYHRRTRTRLGTEYASEEFCRLYWEAEKGGKAAPKAGRTLGTLITHYRGSDRYGDLKPRTRSDYDKVLDYIGEKAGHTPVAHWQRKHVIDVMDGNRHRIRFANYIVAVLSVVFEHAIDIGWLAENPAKGVRKIKTEVKNHLPWPPEVVDAYRQVASNHALLAMELGIATGQRPSDLVKLRWCDWDGEGFTLVQGKTGRELYIPATRRLRQALARAPQRSPFVLTGQEGRPLTYSGLAQAVSRACKRAGIKGYTPHGWRYTAAHELAALGCSDDEIAAITGHTSRAMVAQYSGFVRQKARAKKAQDKRD